MKETVSKSKSKGKIYDIVKLREKKVIETAGDALAYIEAIDCRGSKPGLERIKKLLKKLGNPHKGLHYIHVAGTNGKGSVCAMIESVLREGQFTVGLFTSPHLKRITERIKVNGNEISDEEFAANTERVRACAYRMRGDKPTQFEIMTAIAFLHFARCRCAYVVLETGMGGEFDSTNVIRAPDVAVLTPISLDHTKQLGKTVEEIALTKCGIIKRGCRVVTSVQQPEVERIIRAVCRRKRVPLTVARPDELKDQELSITGLTFSYGEYSGGKDESASDNEPQVLPPISFSKYLEANAGGVPEQPPNEGAALSKTKKARPIPLVKYQPIKFSFEQQQLPPDRMHIPLIGEHQAVNASIAIAVIKNLNKTGQSISDAVIRAGLAKTKWPGRFELLNRFPPVFLDGAHNPQGMQAAANTLKQLFPDRKVIFVTGVMADKDIEHMYDELIPLAKAFFTVAADDSGRAMSAHRLATRLKKMGAENCHVSTSLKNAINGAYEMLGRDGVMCITGSLYMAGEVREIFDADWQQVTAT